MGFFGISFLPVPVSQVADEMFDFLMIEYVFQERLLQLNDLFP